MNEVAVYAAPLPFSNKQIKQSVPQGATIGEMVHLICPDRYKNTSVGAKVFINGEAVPTKFWDSVRPKMGTIVNIRIVPTGGGGGGKKNPIATLLSIAVLVAAPYVGAALGTSLGLGITGTGVLTAGQTAFFNGLVSASFGAVARLAISALAPPPKPSNVGYNGSTSINPSESPTQFIEGANNALVPFGVVPVCLGTNRMFPLQAARPFTETQNNEQYVRQLFTYGWGSSLVVADKKIGESSINDFNNFEIESKLAGDLHSGTTIYSDDVFQDNFSILLDFDTGYVTRTTQVDIDESIIDISFPGGLIRYGDDGSRVAVEIVMQIDYAVAGSGSWVAAETKTVKAAQKEALIVSTRIQFPTNDQYDVRVKRVTEDKETLAALVDSNPDQISDEFYFTSLKSVTHQSPVNLEGINGDAVRIKATDQLNGALSQYNALVSNEILDYDVGSDTWIQRATSNPASIYRYVLQGAPNGKALADSKLLLDDFKAWHIHCETEGYTYNRVIDYETSVDEILRDVASAGAATPAIVDGKRTIAVDQVKNDITQIITPRNSWGYNGEMIYSTLPHAFRVQFRNADKGYQQDEIIVYDDGFDENNATDFETLEVQSCTNATLGFKTGRRHIAAARLRPETHTWMMDVENIVALRGNRVKLEHDAPIIGIGDGRITAITTSGDSPDTVTGFTIDDSVTIPTVSTFYVRIRLSDSTLLYKELITSVGETSSFTFAVPFTIADIPAIGDLCYFVEAGGELDLLITRIEPRDDLTARMVGIDYAQPAINDAENSAIPGFDSKITTPLGLVRPLPPVLLNSQSNESVMLLNSDGTFLTRAVFTLQNDNEGDIQTFVKIRVAGSSVFSNSDVLDSSPETLSITGLEDGLRYDVHIRYKRGNSSMYSLPLEINNFLFEGASAEPENVATFKMDVIDNTAFFAWVKNTDIDIAYYTIKYSNVFTGASWGTAQLLEEKIYENRFVTPFLPGTYLIKAVDIAGNESVTATAIITYDPGDVANAIAELIEAPTFAGVKDNVALQGSSIVLADTALTDGYYYFDTDVDLGAVFTSIISSTVVANGTYVNNIFAMADIFQEVDIFGVGGNDFFAIPDLFAEDDIFGIGTDSWAVQLEFRTTQTDPNDSPSGYGAWEVFTAGTKEFWAIQFRIKLTSLAQNISPQVTTLTVNVDMPDRIERGDDLTVPVAGTTVTYDPEFNASPAVAITIQDGATDDKIEYTSKTSSGFTFKVYNDTAASYVQRTFDYIVSGYGRRNV